MKDLNEYLPAAIRKNWEIVSPSTGKPISSTNGVFSAGIFDAVNAETVSEKKMEALYRKKHPMIRKRVVEEAKVETSKKAQESK
jgi:hypothetical protein